MKKQNLRIGVRISNKLRKEMEIAVSSGKFSSISELIRKAVKKILKEGFCI